MTATDREELLRRISEYQARLEAGRRRLRRTLVRAWVDLILASLAMLVCWAFLAWMYRG